MIAGLFALLACQLFGETIARGAGLPVPGPVLGLAILVVGLAAWARFARPDPAALERSGVGRVAEALLANLALLFVPAGVGVIQHLDLLGTYGLALAAALVGSTLLTLLATVGMFLAVKRRLGALDEPQP